MPCLLAGLVVELRFELLPGGRAVDDLDLHWRLELQPAELLDLGADLPDQGLGLLGGEPVGVGLGRGAGSHGRRDGQDCGADDGDQWAHESGGFYQRRRCAFVTPGQVSVGRAMRAVLRG
jgi:hypothetical protein